MRTVGDLVVGLIRAGLLSAGVLYAVDVIVDYLSLGGHRRPEYDPSKRLRSAWELSVWAGVAGTDLVVRMIRPVVNMLSEASADVGQWAVARHEARVATRGH